MTVIAEQCPCGHPSCKTWGVSNGTFYQGCGWEKESAEFVAWCFNNKEDIAFAMTGDFTVPDSIAAYCGLER